MGITIVPTPIGNLRDITLRALDVLRDCAAIYAEDTRVTRRLLSAHGISGKLLVPFHAHNLAAALPGILERASTSNVAIVSDAGMPAIADPGREVIAAARAAGIAIDVLPGATAFVCAAVLSGFDLTDMVFAGFLPRAAGQLRRAFADAGKRGSTTIWYESPQRIRGSLAALAGVAPDATVFVARELTKMFEQQLLGTATGVLAELADPVRGEIVVVLAPQKIAAGPKPTIVDVDRAIDDGLARGEAVAALAKRLSGEGFGTRQEMYSRASARKPQTGNAARNR